MTKTTFSKRIFLFQQLNILPLSFLNVFALWGTVGGKLRSLLLKTKKLTNVVHLKPGVGQNVAMYSLSVLGSSSLS